PSIRLDDLAKELGAQPEDVVNVLPEFAVLKKDGEIAEIEIRPGPWRINELARHLDSKSFALLKRLPGLGINEKKTHSSAIDPLAATKLWIRVKLDARNAASKPPENQAGEEKSEAQPVAQEVSGTAAAAPAPAMVPAPPQSATPPPPAALPPG